MKIVLHIFLIALTSYLAELIFPWWTAAVCAFIILALLPTTNLKAFFSGFLGVGLLWLGGALFYSIRTDYILTAKVAELMQLGSPALLILITAFIGGIAGGLGALSGNLLHDLIRPRTPYRTSRYGSGYNS